VTVTCRETRELADPFLSDQLLVETTHEIVKHLETCPGCRDEFAARRTLRGQLQSAVASSRDLAPRPDFAAQLAANLRPAAAAAQMTRRAWLESWWAAAAALVALVGGGIFARDAVKRSRLATLAANAAGDHQNCAIKFNLRERPIPLEEAARRYRRFGHVVFRYEDHIVSLLVTSGSTGSGSAPALVANNTAYRVASFDAGTHAVFVVSDLPERDVLGVAQALAASVTQRLTQS
jgi:hypothetical protein